MYWSRSARARGSVGSLSGLRQGVKGAAQDGSLLGRRWTAPLNEITGPVHVWHGEQDSLVPISTAQAHADRLPHAARRWCPDDGHISTIVKQTTRSLRHSRPSRSWICTSNPRGRGYWQLRGASR